MDGARITHIGGPTVLIETEGWRILSDPTFDPPGRRYGFGWGTSSRKIAGPAIAAGEIGPIDAVLLSHDTHADNLDDAGRALLPGADTVVTTAAAAGRLGVRAQGLQPWETTRLEAPGRQTIEVTATPCRHGPPLSRGLVGAVIGFALGWSGQENGALWISGDTVVYDGVRQVAERLRVDTAIVHLGAVRFPITGPLHYSMNGSDAVELCRLIHPQLAIPVHYEGWSHFSEGKEGIERAIAAAPEDIQAMFKLLPIGEPTRLGRNQA